MCFQIDPNLNQTRIDDLKTARYSIPLALVRDKYIFAMGGMLSKNKLSNAVEYYDMTKN